MMDDNIRIRAASPEDAEELLRIYTPYVEKTAISFEYDVPDTEEFRKRIINTQKKYPYLVVETAGGISGYAYTGSFVGRAAYNHDAEVSVYLREDRRRQGLGKALYTAIEEISKAQHITNLYACIGYPEEEDEYLTRNSAQFHEHLGYKQAGVFRKCGYKFGRWYHMVWMEKMIGEHGQNPQPFIPFPELEAEALQRIGSKLSDGNKEVRLWR